MGRTCMSCHTPIEGQSNRVYCSSACKQRAFMQRQREGRIMFGQPRDCAVCGGRFDGLSSNPFCSDACRAAYLLPPDTRSCVRCGKALTGHQSMYCGNTCRVMANRMRRQDRSASGQWERPCPHCNTPFTATNRRKYCSTVCAATVLSTQRKEGAHRWLAQHKNDPEFIAQKAERAKQKRVRLRLAAFEAYGGQRCTCCGETTYEFLSIDHIDGGGGKHRRSLATMLEQWLKANNYPPGFRVLCHNCNQARGAYGYCPHERTE